MTDTEQAKAIKPANKRGAARLGAVQALYQMDIGGMTLEQIIDEYQHLRLGQEIDGIQYRPADMAYFRHVVSGVLAEQRILDPFIHKLLPDDWPLKRIDSLLRAVLRAGAYEMLKHKDVPAKVIINEYVDVTNAYYAGEEPKLVNGVLDGLAKELRADEITAKA